MKLALRLPLIVGAAFIAFAALSSVLLIVAGRRTLARSELEHLSLNAADYGAAITLYLKSAREELALASQMMDTASTRQQSRIMTVVARRSSVFAYLYLLRADGSMVMVEPKDLFAKLYQKNFAFRAWFRAVISTGAPTISDLHISVPTGGPAVVVAVPVFAPDGSVAEVFAGSILLQNFSRAGSGGYSAGDRKQFGYLTDSRGLVIAHESKPKYVIEQTDFSSEPTVRAAFEGRQGTMTFFDPIEKAWMLAAFLPILLPEIAGGHPWAVCVALPQGSAFAPIVAFSRTIAVSAALFALAFGMFSFFIIRRFLLPLEQLTAAVHQAAAGDFSHRITPPGQGEFSSITEAYNSMADKLSEKDRRIREHEAELLKANDRLAESNHELEAFSYSVSHDLRAPLRAIDGFSHALLEDYGEVLGGEGKDFIDRVRRGVQRMGDLIEDMLKLSRVNRVELTRETVDLSALLGSQAEELAARDPGREVQLIIEPVMFVKADRRLLQILVGNLLENAWKFSKSRIKARIECGSIVEQGATAFFVRDNGVGFDMKYVGKLFSAFQRLHERSEYEGTGIGLVIVQRIAIRHGGRAWANAVLNEGATFFFTLQG
jgi:signal transduction histidine kinase